MDKLTKKEREKYRRELQALKSTTGKMYPDFKAQIIDINNGGLALDVYSNTAFKNMLCLQVDGPDQFTASYLSGSSRYKRELEANSFKEAKSNFIDLLLELG